MKKLAVLLIALTGLAGCVVYPLDGGHDYRGYRERDGAGHRPSADPDRDGVPKRYDRRPGNPYRY